MDPINQSQPKPDITITTSTSTSLIERVKARDPQAWQRLVKLYSPMAYRWCREMGVSAEDSKDILQEVFTSVFGSIAEFRRTRAGDSFRAWLCTITRNKVRDMYRRRANQPVVDGGSQANELMQQVPDDDCPTSSSPADQGSENRLVQQAAELVQCEFETQTWQVFWRAAVQGQKLADIADDLGMSLAAVYQAKSRVMRRLRQELSDTHG